VKPLRLPCPALEGVTPARQIHYWGHYPVADLEFETDAPISIGLRAWSPFIPGDRGASGIPAAVFEVHLRNATALAHRGTIAFNFPGPDEQEARSASFERRPAGDGLCGIEVRSGAGVSYVLAAETDGPVRFGAGLHGDERAWSRMAAGLPEARPSATGSAAGSASAAADFALEAGSSTIVRFILAWHAPDREGQTRKAGPQSKPDEPGMRAVWVGNEPAGASHWFRAMYAARYRDAREVALHVAGEHGRLLRRVIAWQEAVYGEPGLPTWLRDCLVNNLALVAEDSLWVQGLPPLGDWAHPEGVFGMTESPRACPTTANIPCDWYGNFPIVFFFPELARSTLRAFAHYQTGEGEIPFALGAIDLPDFAVPGYFWQVSLNAFCWASLVDRLWLATGDDGILAEFYGSVKRSTVYTMGLSRPPAAAIRMPEVGGMEWFEWGEWTGWTAHAGGLRLAWLGIVERMAAHEGDEAFAARCRAWREEGSRAMDGRLWTGGYYLNYLEPETGKVSDVVMGYQLDGEWVARYHGLPGVFPEDRVETTLATIERCNMTLTPDIGAANFARADGTPLPTESRVAYYGAYAMFTPELLLLAFTFIGAGHREKGLDLAARFWENLVLRQRHPWDLPNIVEGKTGTRHFGSDYYQNMLLWVLPEVLAGRTLDRARAEGGLVRRVMDAGSA
jgi:non-lysosomal glucosylceramidase